LLFPPFSCALSMILPLSLCARLQFTIYCSVFWWGISLPMGLCWFIPGIARGNLCDIWHSCVWSAQCLTGRFGASGGDSGGSNASICSSSGSPQVFSV
jgi:hypothetical protein